MNTVRLVLIVAAAIVVAIVAWQILAFVTAIVFKIVSLAILVGLIYIVFLIARSAMRKRETAEE